MENSISLSQPKITAIDFSAILEQAKNYVLAQDILSLLTKHWCVQKIGNDSLYLKHIYNEEENSLYQIVLSSNIEYSGIYKMELRGKDFNCKLNDDTFLIKTNNFFELAPFYTSKQITELRMKDSVDFKQKLLEHAEENNVDHIIFLNNDKNTYIRNANFNKFKIKLIKFYEKNKDNIAKASFVEKKKEYYISRFDLTEPEFKKHIIALGYITEKEYNMFANKSVIKDTLLKIEII